MRRVLATVSAVLVGAYPILLWAASSRVSGRALGVIILTTLAPVLLLRARSGGGAQPPEILVIGLAASLVLFAILLDDRRFLLAEPVLVNAVLLFSFGQSLVGGRTPIVERFARMARGEISRERIAYCRAVTKVWCAFFLLSGCLSLWLALYASPAAWALYTGTVVYLAVAALFAGEYAVRKMLFD